MPKDFIFIIGASGVGKTTLSKGLFEHYNGAYVEMHMVPEFGIPENEDPGFFEETVCWESIKAQLKKINEFEIKNIVCSDLDDLRTADIPIAFKGYDYIALKLICSEYEQHYEQMKNRQNGLIDFELLQKMSDKVNNRPLLINEVLLDISSKTPEQVLKEAIDQIEEYQTKIDYRYSKPRKELFYSWVHGNDLR